MNALHLKITVIALALLLFSQGCSFYAGFHTSGPANSTEKSAQGRPGEQASD